MADEWDEWRVGWGCCDAAGVFARQVILGVCVARDICRHPTQPEVPAVDGPFRRRYHLLLRCFLHLGVPRKRLGVALICEGLLLRN